LAAEALRKHIPYRKEVSTMRYERPEIVALDGAIRAVRGPLQKQSPNSDNNPPGNGKVTPTAYEADE